MAMLDARRILRRMSWRPRLGGLARSTLGVLFWNIVRLGMQLLWVIVLARSLGAEGYGTFSGIAGLAIGLSGLVGAGLGLKMYHDVARAPGELGERWSQASTALAWSGGIIAVIFFLAAPFVFTTVPLALIGVIAASELLVAPVVAQSAFGFAAVGQMERSASVPAGLAAARVAAATAFLLAPVQGEVVVYGVWHLLATTAAAWVASARFRKFAQMAPRKTRLTLSDYRAGLGYTSVWASSLAMTSVDKASALNYGGAELAGNYSVAQRFSGLAALPVDALATAVLPRLFRAGPSMASQPLLWWLVAVTVAYGAAAGALVWWVSPLAVLLLGDQFETAVPAMKIMALYVTLYCLRSVGGTVLLGFDFKLWRFICEMAALGVMVCFMAVWIPVWGILGAAWALILAEGMLTLLIWARIVFRPRAIAGERT